MTGFALEVGMRLAMEPWAWVHQDLGGDLVAYADFSQARGCARDLVVAVEATPLILAPVFSGPAAVVDDLVTREAQEYPANDFDWSAAEGTELASTPSEWHVRLDDGNELLVYANDVHERDDEYLFTLAVAGDGPPLPVLLFGRRLVVDVQRRPPSSEDTGDGGQVGRR